ncbi:hypothetical protein KIPB_012339, partial [Kipferlia bialata]|eukprot:g12339.t1
MHSTHSSQKRHLPRVAMGTRASGTVFACLLALCVCVGYGLAVDGCQYDESCPDSGSAGMAQVHSTPSTTYDRATTLTVESDGSMGVCGVSPNAPVPLDWDCTLYVAHPTDTHIPPAPELHIPCPPHSVSLAMHAEDTVNVTFNDEAGVYCATWDADTLSYVLPAPAALSLSDWVLETGVEARVYVE